MIDFVHQIDLRLREFQRLTGKGNIKDCHQILYEIVRLLVAMIRQPRLPRVAGEPMRVPVQPTDVTAPISPPVKIVNAPYGLTRFGNPRRKPRITP